jgi:hypothetical protein
MKQFILYLFISCSAFAFAQQVDPPVEWSSAVLQKISTNEYHISTDDLTGKLQSPNRKHNFRAIYDADQLIIKARIDTNEAFKWSVGFEPLNFSRTAESKKILSKNITESHQANQVIFKSSDIDYIYQNSEKGIELAYQIHEKIPGNTHLFFHIQLNTNLLIQDNGQNELMFYEKKDETVNPKMRLNALKVFDANGASITSVMYVRELNGKQILTIEIDDANAVYPLLIDPLAITPEWIVTGLQAYEYLGFSYGYAGDVNNDGYDDIVAGAFRYDNGSTDEGMAFLYLGSATGPSTTAAWTAESNQASSRFGFSICGTGDVNGDGYDDVVTGASLYDGGSTDEGRLYLYLGNSTGLNTTAAWTYEVNQSSAYLGENVSAAGDVNNDGFDDLLVGNDDYNSGAYTNSGRISVFYGSAAGLPAVASWTFVNNQTSAQLGISTSAADVNGDSYSDIIAGSLMYDAGETNEGRVYVFYGSASGLPATPSWTTESNIVNLSLGQAVSTAGDINNDGYDEIMASSTAKVLPGTSLNVGAVYIYYGSETGLETVATDTIYGEYDDDDFGFMLAGGGNMNNDDYDDILISSDNFNLSGNARVYLFNGSETGINKESSWGYGIKVTNSYTYPRSIALNGDINADGIDDLLIGDHSYSSSNGRLLLFYGGEIIPLIFPDFDEDIYQASCNFGYQVASTGDLNNDGFDDVMVAAPYFDNGSTDEGKVFCFLGHISGLDTVYSSSAEGNQDYAYFGTAIDNIGDYNSDGYDDVIIGAPGFDHLLLDEGKVYVYKGITTGISYLPVKTYVGGQTSANIGFSVSGVRDINNDTKVDIAYASPYYDDGLVDQGKLWIYTGTGSGFSSIPFFTKSGSQASSNFGWAISKYGDFNGDHFYDIMVSEPGFDNLYLNAGKVSLFFGNTLISPIPSWSFEGDQAEAKLGYSLTSVNHNDDIYDDILLSQPFYDNGQTDEGRVLLFNGNESVFPAIPSWINESNLANAQYGFSMASAGDLNNDGYGDFAIGGIYNEFDKTDEGTVDLFYGTHYGAGMVKNAVIKGGQTSSKFGYSTASAGDVNGDGNDELLIGAPLFDNGLTDQGLISVLYGDTSTCIYDFNFLSLSTDETNAHIVFDDKAVTRRYDIRWKTFYDINWQYDSTYSTESVDISGLSACTPYIFEIQKICVNGNTSWRQFDTATTSGCPADCSVYPITGISISEISISSATATWTDPGPVYDFQIRYRKTGAAPWIVLNSFTPSFTFSGLDSCSNFELQIRSNCLVDFGPWSALINFTTAGSCVLDCLAPVGLYADNLTSNSAKLHWSAMPGATKYKISYRPLGGGSWINVNSTTTIKTVSGLLAGTMYEFKVKTICGVDNSEFSPVQTFTTLLRTANLQGEVNIVVFPNPNNGKFQLSLGDGNSADVQISVVNALSQIVYSKFINDFSEGTIDLRDLNLATGLYFIKVENDEILFHTCIEII